MNWTRKVNPVRSGLRSEISAGQLLPMAGFVEIGPPFGVALQEVDDFGFGQDHEGGGEGVGGGGGGSLGPGAVAPSRGLAGARVEDVPALHGDA